MRGWLQTVKPALGALNCSELRAACGLILALQGETILPCVLPHKKLAPIRQVWVVWQGAVHGSCKKRSFAVERPCSLRKLLKPFSGRPRSDQVSRTAA